MRTPFAAALLLCCSFLSAAEVDEEMQQVLGEKTAALAPMTLPPEAEVFGTVLSPAPLVDLFRQSEAARAAVTLSAAVLDRAEKLNAAGELVAAKEVQTSRAQATLDAVALRGIEDRIALEWGVPFAALAAEERTKWIEAALSGKRAMVRLSMSQGEAKPVAARLHFAGSSEKSFRCTGITPAVTVDPVFQARTFLGTIETPDAPLPPGSLLSGMMELEGKPVPGFLVATDLVVFHLGKAWVYRKTGEDDFERVEVPVNSPVEGGWFVAEGGIKPSDIVVAGVQSLLSQDSLIKMEED